MWSRRSHQRQQQGGETSFGSGAVCSETSFGHCAVCSRQIAHFQLHRVSFVSKLEMASLARFTVTSAFAFGFRMGWFKLGESSLPNYLNPS